MFYPKFILKTTPAKIHPLLTSGEPERFLLVFPNPWFYKRPVSPKFLEHSIMKLFQFLLFSIVTLSFSLSNALDTACDPLEQKRVVFGIGSTLINVLSEADLFLQTARVENEQLSEAVVLMKKALPECRIVETPNKGQLETLAFIPHVEHLFRALIDQGVQVCFFSATEAPLPEDLIATYATACFGKYEYEKLKAQGQFQVFSKHHLRPATPEEQGDSPSVKLPGCLRGDFKKDLKISLPKDVRDAPNATKNTILVDVHFNAVAFGQHTQFVPLRDPHDPLRRYIHYLSEPQRELDGGIKLYMNHIYYMYGVLQHCLDGIQSKKFPSLSAAVEETLFREPLDTDYKITFNRYPDLGDSKTREFVQRGLTLMQKRVSGAHLYGIPLNQVS
jgi:hypothetical protein